MSSERKCVSSKRYEEPIDDREEGCTKEAMDYMDYVATNSHLRDLSMMQWLHKNDDQTQFNSDDGTDRHSSHLIWSFPYPYPTRQ